MVAAVSSTSSSCIQFQLGVQIIFITFFTKHCWHSWFVMGMLSDDMSLSSKEKKTVFGAVGVVVVVVMGLGFTMTVVVQRIYAGGKDWMIA
jgi:succinate dehydrogenase hydrophobic anchor subunit